jgi:hypothetical protein
MAKLESFPEFGDVQKLSVQYVQKLRRTLRSRLRPLVHNTVHKAGNLADKVDMLQRDIKRLSDAMVRRP